MRFFFIMAAIAIVTLVGCTTPPAKRPRAAAPEARPCCRSVERAPSRTAIVRTAAKLVGSETIESNGRRIAYGARALNEDIVVDRAELEDARWFARDEAQLMITRKHPDGLAGPHPFAIAHHLLGRWLHDQSHR